MKPGTPQLVTSRTRPLIIEASRATPTPAKKTTTCPHSRTRIQVLQTTEKLRTDDNLTEFLHGCRDPLKMSSGPAYLSFRMSFVQLLVVCSPVIAGFDPFPAVALPPVHARCEEARWRAIRG